MANLENRLKVLEKEFLPPVDNKIKIVIRLVTPGQEPTADDEYEYIDGRLVKAVYISEQELLL